MSIYFPFLFLIDKSKKPNKASKIVVTLPTIKTNTLFELISSTTLKTTPAKVSFEMSMKYLLSSFFIFCTLQI